MTKKYPFKCKKCDQPLYGPVKYCPFCGAAVVQEPVAVLSSLTITTNAVGGVIFLNGERKGAGPLTINDLERDSYTVRVEADGYKSKEERISLGQEDQTVNIVLEEIKKPLPPFTPPHGKLDDQHEP